MKIRLLAVIVAIRAPCRSCGYERSDDSGGGNSSLETGGLAGAGGNQHRTVQPMTGRVCTRPVAHTACPVITPTTGPLPPADLYEFILGTWMIMVCGAASRAQDGHLDDHDAVRQQDQQVAAAAIVEDGGWLGKLQEELRAAIAPVFCQARSRLTAFAYIGGAAGRGRGPQVVLAAGRDRRACHRRGGCRRCWASTPGTGRRRCRACSGSSWRTWPTRGDPGAG